MVGDVGVLAVLAAAQKNGSAACHAGKGSDRTGSRTRAGIISAVYLLLILGRVL